MDIKRTGSHSLPAKDRAVASLARSESIRSIKPQIGPRRGASVTFEPGAHARMAHAPAGPDDDRDGRLRPRAALGRPIEEIRPGDVIWFSPGESTGAAQRQPPQ